MIIEQSKNEIIRGGNVCLEEKQMRIKASAKAFKVLSDSLYSDKIFAVIREISCNAYDAHIDAGKSDQPFIVTLPNSFNSNLIVRDFGKGISDENMDNIFTVFFESTKTDVNSKSSFESVGMLGLGCKSPLAYTDSFMVESFINNRKNVYSIYKNEEGVPCCTRMSSEESSEPCGLQVTIPVKSADFSNFSSKAKEVFIPFKVKPIIKGSDIKIPEKNYTIFNDVFGMRDRDWSGAKAIMGNISYPLNDLTDSSLSDVDKCILDLDIDIYFDLGKLDVSASREKLSYDKITISNVIERLSVIKVNLQKTIQDTVTKCDTLWDARVMYKKIVQNQNYRNIYKELKIVYNGVELSEFNLDISALRYDLKSGIKADSKLTEKDQKFVVNKYSAFTSRTGKMSVARSHNIYGINVDRQVVFVINDDDFKKMNKIRNYLLENPDKTLYCFEFKSESSIDNVLSYIGIKSFIKLSEMPYKICERVVSGSTERKYNSMYSKKVFKYTPEKNKNTDKTIYSNYWTSVDVNDDESVFYVMIDRFKIKDVSPDDYFEYYFQALKEIGIDYKTISIYGVKSVDSVGSSWIKFEDYVIGKIKEYLNINSKMINFFMYKTHESIKEKIDVSYTWGDLCLELSKKIKDNNDLKILADFYGSKNPENSYGNCLKVYGDMTYQDNETFNDYKKKLFDAANNFNNKYPMLSCVGWNYYDKNEKNRVLNNCVNYVNSTF